MSIYILISLLLVAVGVVWYRRYFPVRGIPCGRKQNIKTVILDIRDYNERIMEQGNEIQIPYAYLKRYKKEIPTNYQLHVIANDRLELNLGIRYLMKNGYKVSSYEVTNDPCGQRRKNDGI